VTLRRHTPTETPGHVERGIRDLEAHLLWAAEVAGSRSTAQRFASRFAWATTDEREDLARVYAHQRLEDSHQMIERVADRATTLQAQYDARWRQATSRLVLGMLLTLAAVVFIATLLTALR
jgi:hypothetical protein